MEKIQTEALSSYSTQRGAPEEQEEEEEECGVTSCSSERGQSSGGEMSLSVRDNSEDGRLAVRRKQITGSGTDAKLDYRKV